MQIFLLDTKACMNQLLLQSAFDSFLFIEGEIVTFNTFRMDGHLRKDFYHVNPGEESAVPDREFSLWKDVRDFSFSLIKGKRTPLSFRFILALSPSNTARLLETEDLSFQAGDVHGLYLNFHYDGSKLTCTTGTSMNVFTLDKSLETAWDQMVARIFAKYDITFELPD